MILYRHTLGQDGIWTAERSHALRGNTRSGRLLAIAVMLGFILILGACSGGRQQAPQSAQGTQGTQSLSTASTLTTSNPDTVEQQVQSGSEDDAEEAVLSTTNPGRVEFSFDYVRQSGSASNQFAVWVEDAEGQYRQTVFTTRWTAAGGYKTRPDSLAIWVGKSSIASMPSYYVDAITGATPQTGSFSCVWDLTDIDGNTVPDGVYTVYIEGTLRWKNYVLFSGTIPIGGDQPITIQAEGAYVYAGSGNQSALTEDSPENRMIGPVTVSYLID